MNSQSDTWKINLVNFLRINVQSALKLYEYNRFNTVKDNATTSNICSALETLFLHKHSSRSMSVFFGSPGNDVKDQLSFWGFLKVFIPQHLSAVLSELGVKRSYVGRCRVWIRDCLNEGSLSNYLTVIKNSENHIKRFYAEGAIIRDSYNLQNIIDLVEMLDELQFQLDLTSPLLNSWATSKAKQLLAVESDNMICSDYAGSLFLLNASIPVNFWDSKNVKESSVFDCVSCQVSTQICGEDLDSVFVDQETMHSSPCDTNIGIQSQEDSVCDIEPTLAKSEIPLPSTELRLHTTDENATPGISPDNLTAASEASSLASLHLPNLYSPSNNLANQSTWITLPRNSRKVSARWEKQHSCRRNDQRTAAHRPDLSQPSQPASPKMFSFLSQWQIVGDELAMELSTEHVNSLVKVFPGAKCYDMEGGKNSVFNGECRYCHKMLSPDASYLDHYDTKVYCEMCHQLQQAILPHSVVYNWDFSLWSVSEATRVFLTSTYWKPIINLALLNPSLYVVVPELMIVRQLRRKLVILWHLVSGCDTSTASALCRVIEELPSSGLRYHHRSQIPTRRQYMLMSLKDLDLFSLGDLRQVQTGELKSTLLSAINSVALIHLSSCRTCRRHMLLCDICESLDRPIWPHEFMSYAQCTVPGCLHVMHITCLLELQHTICSQENHTYPVHPSPVHNTGCFPLARNSISRTSNSSDDQVTNRLRNFQQCRSCHHGQGPAAYGSPKAVAGHYSDPYFTTY